MRVIFYYDVVCPFAYLASVRVADVVAKAGGELVWQPILLGGVFRAIGAADSPAQAMPPAKAKLSLLDMQRYATLYGVPLALPAGHPRRTVEAMRLLHTVDGEDRVRLTHALYRAYFADGRDISDRSVLAAICGESGLPATLASARIDDAAVKEKLRAATDEAVADDVFGVPSFVVVDGARRTMFWGQDRLHFVERALGGWIAP